MKKIIALFFIFTSLSIFGQKDSLQPGDKYLEDQLYFGVTYNQLFSQPNTVVGSGFSYGISTGYIRDISLVKSGRMALGIGIGYAFDSMNHGFKISNQNNSTVIEVDTNNSSSNPFKIHSLEFPIEIRWRTSNANKYKFWRVYSGLKISYNLKNTFEYADNGIVDAFSNIERLNKVQYGLTLSAGYSTFNFTMYYGLTPIFKDVNIGTNGINTKVIKLGLLFYIL
jgi:hypothetical protein